MLKSRRVEADLLGEIVDDGKVFLAPSSVGADSEIHPVG